MRKVIFICMALLVALPLSAQTDKREVRRGNRKFGKQNYKEAELDYRRALVKDSTSFAATYDLASALYKQKDYDGAGAVLARREEAPPETADGAKYYFNAGDIALQKKDYDTAMKAFQQALIFTPDDLEAKENYLYAKAMKENQEQQQNQDQQNKDQKEQAEGDNKDQQPKEQPQDQQDQQQQPQEQKISPQQAQQMLQAIQAKEKETQEKVEKAKALQAKTRQKEKNW